MIYDKLSNLSLYQGLNENLDKAIQYITTHNLNDLPLGKTVIDGNLVYINVMEKRSFEIHKNYMDIQMDLIGIERVDTGDYHKVTIENYNQDSDVATAESDTLAGCILGPGNFIICMANEPHKPNIAVTEDTFLKF